MRSDGGTVGAVRASRDALEEAHVHEPRGRGRSLRLFDELLDWLSLNGRLLSLQRLRNLVPRFPLEQSLVDAVVAWVGQSAPGLRWSTPRPGRSADMTPLFSAEVSSSLGDRDPVFARYGYLRPPVARSGNSVEPDVGRDVAFAFRLRLLFGTGTRAEILRVLLTADEGPMDAARIADEAGYPKRNISESLAALVGAGALGARWSGNERLFHSPRDRWAPLLVDSQARTLPAFISWVHLLPTLLRILLWAEQEADGTDSDYLVSSRARDLVELMDEDLQALGLAPPAAGAGSGADYLTTFEELVDALLQTVAWGSLQASVARRRAACSSGGRSSPTVFQTMSGSTLW